MRTNRTWNGIVFNLGEFALTADDFAKEESHDDHHDYRL
jgi:hypothetical protein